MPILCPVCQAESRLFATRSVGQVAACPSCGHRFLLGSGPGEGVLPAETGPLVDPEVFTARDLELADYFLESGLVSKGGRVLDFGAWDGRTARAFARRGFRVTAVEPSYTEKQKEGRTPFFCSLEELRKAGEAQFDLILMIEVIEHLPDPVKTLSDLRGMTAPGGTLLLSTPNAAGLKARLFPERSACYGSPYHVQFFTPQSLREACRLAGWASFQEPDLSFFVPCRSPVRRGVQRLLKRWHLGGQLLLLVGYAGNNK